MKTLLFNNNIFEAERIIKTEGSIIGYIEGLETFAFSGISDFTLFVLADGQEFDIPEPTLEDKVALLQSEKDALAETLDMVLTEIIPNLGGE